MNPKCRRDLGRTGDRVVQPGANGPLFLLSMLHGEVDRSGFVIPRLFDHLQPSNLLCQRTSAVAPREDRHGEAGGVAWGFSCGAAVQPFPGAPFPDVILLDEPTNHHDAV